MVQQPMTRLIIPALVALLVALSLTTGANAKTGSGGFASLGLEGLTENCGKFVNERRSGSNSQYEAWMLGYMTGVNIHVPGKVDFFERVEEESILLWIERWCFKNPTGHFFEGLRQFEKTLGIR